MEYNLFAIAAVLVKKHVNTQCESYLVTSEASLKPAMKIKRRDGQADFLKCSYLVTC
jgi:hypothetical protein